MGIQHIDDLREIGEGVRPIVSRRDRACRRHFCRPACGRGFHIDDDRGLGVDQVIGAVGEGDLAAPLAGQSRLWIGQRQRFRRLRAFARERTETGGFVQLVQIFTHRPRGVHEVDLACARIEVFELFVSKLYDLNHPEKVLEERLKAARKLVDSGIAENLERAAGGDHAAGGPDATHPGSQ
jgi:hypothetical protein